MQLFCVCVCARARMRVCARVCHRSLHQQSLSYATKAKSPGGLADSSADRCGRCPAAHTICEICLARWGTAAHLTSVAFVLFTMRTRQSLSAMFYIFQYA